MEDLTIDDSYPFKSNLMCMANKYNFKIGDSSSPRMAKYDGDMVLHITAKKLDELEPTPEGKKKLIDYVRSNFTKGRD